MAINTAKQVVNSLSISLNLNFYYLLLCKCERFRFGRPGGSPNLILQLFMELNLESINPLQDQQLEGKITDR